MKTIYSLVGSLLAAGVISLMTMTSSAQAVEIDCDGPFTLERLLAGCTNNGSEPTGFPNGGADNSGPKSVSVPESKPAPVSTPDPDPVDPGDEDPVDPGDEDPVDPGDGDDDDDCRGRRCGSHGNHGNHSNGNGNGHNNGGHGPGHGGGSHGQGGNGGHVGNGPRR